MDVKFRGRTREKQERYQGVNASQVLSWAKGRSWVAVVEMGSSVREISWRKLTNILLDKLNESWETVSKIFFSRKQSLKCASISRLWHLRPLPCPTQFPGDLFSGQLLSIRKKNYFIDLGDAHILKNISLSSWRSPSFVDRREGGEGYRNPETGVLGRRLSSPVEAHPVRG